MVKLFQMLVSLLHYFGHLGHTKAKKRVTLQDILRKLSKKTIEHVINAEQSESGCKKGQFLRTRKSYFILFKTKVPI